MSLKCYLFFLILTLNSIIVQAFEIPWFSHQSNQLNLEESYSKPFQYTTKLYPEAKDGSLVYDIKLKLPPLRGDLPQDILLRYKSNSSQEAYFASPNWYLDLASIRRLPENGFINYKAGRRFLLTYQGQEKELLYLKTEFQNPCQIELPAEAQSDIYFYQGDSQKNRYIHYYLNQEESVRSLQWIVLDETGLCYELGSTAFSRLESNFCSLEDRFIEECSDQSYPFKWLVDRISDRNNNQIRFTYDNQFQIETIEHLDLRIDFLKVRLSDLNLSETIIHDLNLIGAMSSDTVIQDIVINSDNQRLIKYHFSYGVNSVNQEIELRSLQTFGQDDSEFLLPERFEYVSQNNISFSEEPYALSAERVFENGTIADGRFNHNTILIDMNGDALPDQVLAVPDSNLIHVYYNNGHDFIWREEYSEWEEPHDFLCNQQNSCVGKLEAFFTFNGEKHQRAFLMDLNGDFLPDRVIAAPINGVNARFYVAFNNGRTWDEPVEWRDPYRGVWPGTKDDQRDFIDMNGDGFLDRIVGREGGFYVYYNYGQGFEERSRVFWEDPIAVTDQNNPAVGKIRARENNKIYAFIRDFNSDGLPDRIWRVQLEGNNENSFAFAVALNRGGLEWSLPHSDPSDSSTWLPNNKDNFIILDPTENFEMQGFLSSSHDLIDFNGDSFLDRIEAEADVFHYYSFRSKSFDENFYSFAPPVDFSNPTGRATLEEGDFDFETGANLEIFFKDITGDGFSDLLVYSNLNSNYELYTLNFNPFFDESLGVRWGQSQSNQILNSLNHLQQSRGLKYFFAYYSSSWPLESSDPERFQATHHFLPGHINCLREISYEDPHLFGMEEEDSLRKIIVTYRGAYLDASSYPHHWQGFHQQSLRLEAKDFESWGFYQEDNYYNQTKSYLSKLDPDLVNQFSSNSKAVVFYPYRTRKNYNEDSIVQEEFEWFYDQDCDELCYVQKKSWTKSTRESDQRWWSQRSIDYFYDEDYRLIRESYKHNDLGQLFKDHSYTYFNPERFERRLDLIKSESISKGNQLYSKKEYSYDRKGNLSEFRQARDIKNGNLLYYTENYTYDLFGNISRKLVNNSLLQEYSYDENSLFLIEKRKRQEDDLWLRDLYSFNRLKGLPSYHQNSRAFAWRKAFDSFGREIEHYQISTDNNEDLLKRHSYLIQNEDTNPLFKKETWHFKESHPFSFEKPALVTYRDSLGLLKMRCDLSERSNYRLKQFNYSELAHHISESYPQFSEECPYQDFVEAERFKEMKYDLRGRLLMKRDFYSEDPELLITYRNNSDKSLIKKYDYQNNYSEIAFLNSWGQTLRGSNSLGTRLSFQYDPLDRLRNFEINEKTILQRRYNFRSELISEWSSELGRSQFLRDAFGRVIEETDSLGQKRKRKYDRLGNLRKELFYKSDGALEKYVSYDYGSSDPSLSVLSNELFQVLEYDGQNNLLRRESYSYDHPFRKLSLLERFDSRLNHSFRENLTFDKLGALIQRQFVFNEPLSESLFYSYDYRGRLKSICSSIECLPERREVYYQIDTDGAYDELGRLLNVSYGNLVLLERHFESSFYPSSEKFLRADRILSHKNFAYDSKQNLISIVDQMPRLGSKNLRWSFYDGLGRLLFHQYEDDFQLNMSLFDTFGRSSFRQDRYGGQNYSYRGEQTFSPSRVGGRVLEYDARSNLTNYFHRAFNYNVRGQLQRVSLENQNTAFFDYDFMGRRVYERYETLDLRQRRHESEIYHVGDHIEIKNNVLYLNIKNQGQIIAQKALSHWPLDTVQNLSPGLTDDPNHFLYYHYDFQNNLHLMTEGKEASKHGGLSYRRGELVQRFEYSIDGRDIFALNPNLNFNPVYRSMEYKPQLSLFMKDDSVFILDIPKLSQLKLPLESEFWFRW